MQLGTPQEHRINDKGSKTITDDSSRHARWKEHFEEILNRPPPTNPIVITADEVPVAESLKADIKTTTQKLHKVIQMIWENEVMPHEGPYCQTAKEG